MRRALLVVLLTLGLGLGSGAVVQAADSPSLPDSASERARQALADAKAAMAGKGGEATLALAQLFAHKGDLSARERREADAILARPVDGASEGDGAWPAGAPHKRYCTTNVCIHYVSNGSYDDAPPMGNANGNAWPDWVEGTGTYMQTVWNSEVNAQGFRAPAADFGKGGDNRLDVYLANVTPPGLYGYCAAEGYANNTTAKRAFGYCVLDDDFVGYPLKPVPSLKVTAAHEFFHAIQFNFDFQEDPWIMESTATWMEEQVFTEVNDNRYYLQHGQLGRPTVSLDIFEDQGLAQYGNWIFFERMEKDFGAASIKALWQRMGEDGGDQNSVGALTSYIAARNNTLAGYYRGFAAGNVVPKTTYPEGAAYKEAPAQNIWNMGAIGSTTAAGYTNVSINHLANRNIQFNTGTGSTATQLKIDLDLPDTANGSGAFIVVHKADGTKAFYGVTLSATGVGTRTVPFADATVNRVTLTLANGHGTLNQAGFGYKATAVA